MRPESFSAFVEAAAQAGYVERLRVLRDVARMNADRARRDGDTLSKWEAELVFVEMALERLEDAA
jgi:hypothetical protein